jgi:hypothetical protein
MKELHVKVSILNRPLTLVTATLALPAMLITANVSRADSTPVGPMRAGPVTTTTTRPGLLLAVALPH